VRRGTRGEASIDVDATPHVLYALVTAVTRMGEWSTETVRCRWVRGADGPVVGARFRGANRRGWVRWTTTPRVVAADPGREFGFVVPHFGRDLTRWTYRFAGDRHGTTLTETFELLHDLPWYFRVGDRVLLGIRDRRGDLEAAMRQTLQRLKTAAEAAPRAGLPPPS